MGLLLVCSPLWAQGAAQQAVAEVAASEKAVDAAAVVVLHKTGVQLLDVRSDEEWAQGHIAAAQHAPWRDVSARAAKLWPDRAKPIVTYCAAGGRARLAAAALRAAGYSNVLAMNEGGYNELLQAGLPKAP